MSIFWTRWKVIRTIFPYPHGYGTYKKNVLTGQRVLLDSGLSYDDAVQAAKELNR